MNENSGENEEIAYDFENTGTMPIRNYTSPI
jgi:hypothetical protein